MNEASAAPGLCGMPLHYRLVNPNSRKPWAVKTCGPLRPRHKGDLQNLHGSCEEIMGLRSGFFKKLGVVHHSGFCVRVSFLSETPLCGPSQSYDLGSAPKISRLFGQAAMRSLARAHARSYSMAPWDFGACDLCKQGYRQSRVEATNA